jgi:Zn-dependent M28 family amino/carboxypeptidase
VMAGAHLDSVPEGSGINDNGTGSAGLLETALRLGGSPAVNNAVRFGFWGAEESGLVGSTKYVQSLSFEQQLDIALYLNFDMIGSPNAGYFAYDGDDSDGVGSGPGPQGSAQIEQDLVAAMASQGVAVEGDDFDGRSDYGEFIAAGIPSGGLNTGAEVVKTDEQAAKWGGTAGIAFDPNYHTVNDNLANVDRVALERNAKALATVIEGYSQSTEGVNGMQTHAQRAQQRPAQGAVMAQRLDTADGHLNRS